MGSGADEHSVRIVPNHATDTCLALRLNATTKIKLNQIETIQLHASTALG